MEREFSAALHPTQYGNHLEYRHKAPILKNPEVQKLMDAGMSERSAYRHAAATKHRLNLNYGVMALLFRKRTKKNLTKNATPTTSDAWRWQGGVQVGVLLGWQNLPMRLCTRATSMTSGNYVGWNLPRNSRTRR